MVVLFFLSDKILQASPRSFFLALHMGIPRLRTPTYVRARTDICMHEYGRPSRSPVQGSKYVLVRLCLCMSSCVQAKCLIFFFFGKKSTGVSRSRREETTDGPTRPYVRSFLISSSSASLSSSNLHLSPSVGLGLFLLLLLLRVVGLAGIFSFCDIFLVFSSCFSDCTGPCLRRYLIKVQEDIDLQYSHPDAYDISRILWTRWPSAEVCELPLLSPTLLQFFSSSSSSPAFHEKQMTTPNCS